MVRAGAEGKHTIVAVVVASENLFTTSIVLLVSLQDASPRRIIVIDFADVTRLLVRIDH